MTQQIANYVQTTLASGITSGATTATLTSVAGLPTTGLFRLVIKDAAPATTFEIVEVSTVNVGTGVVTFSGGAGVGRGLEGTTAIAHNAGALVGNDITAAMLLLAFPWGTLSYQQAVADQSGITTATDLTNLSALTVFSVVGSGRRIKITAQITAYSSVADDYILLTIQEGATVLQSIYLLDHSAGQQQTMHGSVILQPSAGSHNYKLTLARAAGTGSITMHASLTFPAFILVEDIGT